MPSNRSLRAMQEALGREVSVSGKLLPETLSISDWMERMSGCRLSDEEDIMLKLFQIHHETHPGEALRFQQFAGNAQMLLKDFNDIDLSLADAGAVFESLLHIKEMELEFSETDGDGTSEMQRSYLQFCRWLPECYRLLHERLLAEGCAYQGMMYRLVTENLEDAVAKMPFEKYIFIGFSALSLAEEEIVVHLCRMQKAELLIDCDDAFLDESGKELPPLAGTFIRRLQKRIRPTVIHHDFLHQLEKQIDIYGLPQKSSQADLLPFLLRKNREKDPEASCVIVLLEEGLLLPSLYALAGEKANITMEYRLSHTPAYTLLHHYLTALENIVSLSPVPSMPRIYHRDLRHFLENPIVRERLRITGNEPEATALNLLFYDRAALVRTLQDMKQDVETISGLCNLFFQNENHNTVTENICTLVSFLQHDGMPAPMQELLHFLQERLPPLLEMLKPLAEADTTSVRYMLENLMNRISIPFQSDPESPLQIMGMLETRALDFDNVILLSVNEGVIPQAKNSRTMIPYDVRRHYQLPTYRNQEAIMTYHFYRLLQRAGRISLCYNTDNRKEVQEKSRLIQQLQTAWEGLPNIRINETTVPLPPAQQWPDENFDIGNGPSLRQKMESMRFSPSSINCYLECPLQFCLRHLLKLQMPEEREETIGANVMGTVIHKILEERLRPGNGNYVTDVQKEELVEAFCDEKTTGMRMSADEVCHEKNRLVLALCQRYLNDYLKRFRKEMKEESYTVVKVEERIEECLLPAGGREIRFSGIIDREDLLRDGTHRIADYKSGFVDSKKLTAESMQEILDGKHKEALQLMLYMYVKHRLEKIPVIQGEIISFQHPEQTMRLSIGGRSAFAEEDFRLFESELSAVWDRLSDPEGRFVPDPGKHCSFCDYRDFCSPAVSES